MAKSGERPYSDEEAETIRRDVMPLIDDADWRALVDPSVPEDVAEVMEAWISMFENRDMQGLVAMAADDLFIQQPPEMPDPATYARGPRGLVEAFVVFISDIRDGKITTWVMSMSPETTEQLIAERVGAGRA